VTAIQKHPNEPALCTLQVRAQVSLPRFAKKQTDHVEAISRAPL